MQLAGQARIFAEKTLDSASEIDNQGPFDESGSISGIVIHRKTCIFSLLFHTGKGYGSGS